MSVSALEEAQPTADGDSGTASLEPEEELVPVEQLAA